MSKKEIKELALKITGSVRQDRGIVSNVNVNKT